MKKVCMLFLSMFVSPVFGSGIASNSASAPCTNNTLETYSGNSNLQADWQPNTINLRWYNENEKLTVQSSAQSCVYDGTLTIPSSQPTRTGYTFAGWEVRLPGAYTELEYLESTGTQYINTGVVLTSDNVIYEWNAKDNASRGTSLFGTENSIEERRIFSGILYGGQSNRTVWIGYTHASNLNYNSSDNLFHSWSWFINPNHTTYLVKDGTKVGSLSWVGTLDKSHAIILYGNYTVNYVNQLTNIALKYFKITDNGNVVFNGVPARRNSDNVLGMYDTVTKTFFTNAGSGTFIAGPVVE